MLSVLLGSGSMNNDLILYWSNAACYEIDGKDWTFLYQKPTILYDEVFNDKLKKKTESTFFTCPAVKERMKRTLVFKSPISSGYSYKTIEEKTIVEPLSKSFLETFIVRDQFLETGPTIDFALAWTFFTEEESLEALFTPPYFSKPKYMQYGSIIPGKFDIGQWFRPYHAEILMWNKDGEIHFEEDEPLFYLELLTDKNIVIKQFEYTTKLFHYDEACVDGNKIFGRNQTLFSRYKRFNNTGMRKKILKEIRENLLD